MNKTGILSIIITALSGVLTFLCSLFYSKQKIKNLKNQNKALENQIAKEQVAKEEIINKNKKLEEIKNKSDEEIIKLWEKEKDE